MIPRAEERPLGALFSDLASEMGALLRQELSLVKLEVGENAGRVGRDVGMLAAGGAVLYAGFLALIATLILGLGMAIGSILAAAAIMTIVVLAAGYFLLRRGLEGLKQHNLTPRESIEALNLNMSWAKEQFR